MEGNKSIKVDLRMHDFICVIREWSWGVKLWRSDKCSLKEGSHRSKINNFAIGFDQPYRTGKYPSILFWDNENNADRGKRLMGKRAREKKKRENFFLVRFERTTKDFSPNPEHCPRGWRIQKTHQLARKEVYLSWQKVNNSTLYTRSVSSSATCCSFVLSINKKYAYMYSTI